jgi:hypothetical protein
MKETQNTIQNTLEKTLIDSIEGIKKTGTELVDALYAQAPEVINQLLLWNAVESFIKFIASLLLLCIPFVLYKLGVYAYKKLEVAKSHDEGPFWIVSVLVGGFGAVISIVLFLQHASLTWLKIWIAPKVYLLEYLAAFVK